MSFIPDTTYGTAATAITDTTMDVPSIDEMVAMVREFREKERQRQRGCAAAISQMEPCLICGKRIVYETDPERFVVCRHVRDALKDMSPDARPAVQYPSSLTGIPVHIY